MSPELSMLLVAGLVPGTVLAYLVIGVLPPWWATRGTDAPLGFFDVLRMRFAGVNAWWVVKVTTAARARGETLTHEEVAEAYLDGVDLRAVHAALLESSSQGAAAPSFAVLANQFRHGGPVEYDESDEETPAEEESSNAPPCDSAGSSTSDVNSPSTRNQEPPRS